MPTTPPEASPRAEWNWLRLSKIKDFSGEEQLIENKCWRQRMSPRTPNDGLGVLRTHTRVHTCFRLSNSTCYWHKFTLKSNLDLVFAIFPPILSPYFWLHNNFYTSTFFYKDVENAVKLVVWVIRAIDHLCKTWLHLLHVQCWTYDLSI